MRFDPSGLQRTFDSMSKKANKGGKTLAIRQGYFFRNIARKISRVHAPTADKIAPLIRLGTRLKRKIGVTPPQEIARRISKIKTLSRNWFISKIDSRGFRIRVWITNRVNYSKVVDDKQQLSEQAATIVRSSFQKKLKTLANKLTGDFNHG